MGHHWHPGSGDLDNGIDCKIDVVDAARDEVRNFRIGIRSKATEDIWVSETDEWFFYRAEPDDIAYCLAATSLACWFAAAVTEAGVLSKLVARLVRKRRLGAEPLPEAFSSSRRKLGAGDGVTTASDLPPSASR